MTARPAQSLADPATASGRALRSRVAGQAMLLLSGFAGAQACALVRNAIVGYWLSKGDFGVAATITIALQALETASDLGADRLILQAADGDDPRMMAAAHAMLVLRGFLTGALLYIAAGPIVAFFDIAPARWAFELASAVPVIKGFLHLGARLHQRGFENRSTLMIDLVPQAAALLVTVPLVATMPDYGAVVWLAVLQAVLAVAVSHLLGGRRYTVSFDRAFVRRLLAFGWPIWLSAVPLLAVYYGDRVLIGRFIGIEALAGYSAAFIVTMVPGLVTAKIGHALMLPLLADKRRAPSEFFARYLLMVEGTGIAAAVYLVIFVLAGGTLLPLVFGPNFAGLGAVVGWLAAMWALRMVQAVPGIALLAQGNTRPLLIAGMIRAAALAPALALALAGAGLAAVAAVGVAGELASLAYVTARLERGEPRRTLSAISRSLYPMAAGSAAAAIALLLPATTQSLWPMLPVTGLIAASAVLAGLATMPHIRDLAKTMMLRNEPQRLGVRDAPL